MVGEERDRVFIHGRVEVSLRSGLGLGIRGATLN